MSSDPTNTIKPSKRFYVYILCDGDVPFYVGKGSGSRVYHHETEARTDCGCPKCCHIRSVWERGHEVIKKIVFESDNEYEAVRRERELIASIGRVNLCNRSNGGETGGRPEYISVEALRTRLRAKFKREILPSLSPYRRLYWQREMRQWVDEQVARIVREEEVDRELYERAKAIAEYEGIDIKMLLPPGRKWPKSS
jgi:hypothetical protein